MANPSVTMNDVADLRIHTAVKTYTCRECSKIYQLFDPQKTQTGGKLHECVRCGKALILCSGLTHHHLIFFFFYNSVMVFAVHQHEQATGVHMSPPSWTLSHLSHHRIPPDCPRALTHISNSHWLFTYGNIYVSVLIS